MSSRCSGLTFSGAIKILVALSFVLSAVLPSSVAAGKDADSPALCGGGHGGEFTLAIMHNNDGESELLADGDFGGVDRFAGVVRRLRIEAVFARDGWMHARNLGVLMLSSGDNFLAGPQFNASLNKGVPYYDGIAMNTIDYDAVCIGNHEFDFGPEVLADFIESFRKPTPFLSANLDVSGEPRLQALAIRVASPPARWSASAGGASASSAPPPNGCPSSRARATSSSTTSHRPSRPRSTS